MKNDSKTTLQLFCSKNRIKKYPIFEKWQLFENRQNWSQCMGYSLCKMLSLGQKLKFWKACEKRLLNHITFVLCKKPLQKTPNIRKWKFFENRQNWSQCMSYNLCKMLSLGQKLKLYKNMWKMTLKAHYTFMQKTAWRNT